MVCGCTGAEGGEGVHGACDEWSVDVRGLKVVRVCMVRVMSGLWMYGG